MVLGATSPELRDKVPTCTHLHTAHKAIFIEARDGRAGASKWIKIGSFSLLAYLCYIPRANLHASAPDLSPFRECSPSRIFSQPPSQRLPSSQFQQIVNGELTTSCGQPLSTYALPVESMKNFPLGLTSKRVTFALPLGPQPKHIMEPREASPAYQSPLNLITTHLNPSSYCCITVV